MSMSMEMEMSNEEKEKRKINESSPLAGCLDSSAPPGPARQGLSANQITDMEYTPS